MECRDFTLQLDDWLDGQLDAFRERAIREHLNRCADCRRRHEHALAVQAALRELPAPAPHPSFVDQALSRAVRATPARAPSTRRFVLGMALAASLVLAVALGVFLPMRPAPVQAVSLTLERPETVRLVFNSAKPLQAATLSLALPENIELVGYDGQHELSWQTDLKEGRNLLQLPLIARGAVNKELVARVSHGGGSKTFRLKIGVNRTNAGTAGM
jgi:anti-sigma factor RsiW